MRIPSVCHNPVRGLLACGLLGVACPAPALAEGPEALERYLAEHVRPLLTDELLLDSIRSQNLRTLGFSQEEIERLDLLWRQQVGTDNAPVVQAAIDNPLADWLRQWRDTSDDLIHEAFVMDLVGLNVAAADPTSDYWQGDEPEHATAISQGIYIGELEFDESGRRYQVEVSLPIRDPRTGEIIGAFALGLDPGVFLAD
ncbi:PDC sensor domain-containing protein [Marimonas sp. MJW-29]|uniref:PDC sensor domain-containing protein n=1 Tax=Sulfitobacter sediminis TaxID=3234186 RepID=A0ABV3RPE0_9RHOB